VAPKDLLEPLGDQTDNEIHHALLVEWLPLISWRPIVTSPACSMPVVAAAAASIVAVVPVTTTPVIVPAMLVTTTPMTVATVMVVTAAPVTVTVARAVVVRVVVRVIMRVVVRVIMRVVVVVHSPLDGIETPQYLLEPGIVHVALLRTPQAYHAMMPPPIDTRHNFTGLHIVLPGPRD